MQIKQSKDSILYTAALLRLRRSEESPILFSRGLNGIYKQIDLMHMEVNASFSNSKNHTRRGYVGAQNRVCIHPAVGSDMWRS